MLSHSIGLKYPHENRKEDEKYEKTAIGNEIDVSLSASQNELMR